MTLIESVVAPTGVRRLLGRPSPALSDHLTALGALPWLSAESLITEVERAGLTGRGGAGFPAASKIRAVHDQHRRPIVIGNGSEGEPLSAKDATLLRDSPHLVIDGLLVVARALDAAGVHLVIDAASLETVTGALWERTDAVELVVRAAAPGFVSGEASALAHVVERRRAVPRDHPVRLAVSGVRGAPTLVQNVETLAHIALIARFGGAWFRSIGTDDDPGTRLISVSSASEPGTDRPPTAPRVLEAAGGTAMTTLLRVAGIDDARIGAVLVGGYHGTWLPAVALGARFCPTALAAFGATPGAGVIHALPAAGCGLAETARIVRYLAGQSARQCGPCQNGLPRIADLLTAIADRRATRAAVDDVRRVSSLVVGRGACHHPDGTAHLVASALTTFAADVEAHFAGTCRGAR